MSVTLTNINGFIEQVGLRIVQEKPNSLDTVDSIFLGPASLSLGFLPQPKSRHPTFPLMYCSRAEIGTHAGALAEVRASYVGKLVGAGSGVYVTSPEVHRSSHLGSISYTNTISTTAIQLATYSYTVRYTALGVTFKYLTNVPSAARFSAQATPYLGTTNLLTFQSAPISYSTGIATSISGVYGGYLQNTLVWKNDLTSLDVNDLDNGWYEVSEDYMTQPYINSSIV